MLKLALLIASAAAFQPRSTKVQPKTVQNFGMLDGLFKKSEADVTEKVYFDISIGGAAPQRVELGLYGATRCINHFAGRLRPRLNHATHWLMCAYRRHDAEDLREL